MTEAGETRWLDDEERQAWISLIAVAMQLGPALDAQMRRDAGISHFEYTVMSALSESPERTLRMSDLAALADGSLSRLSQVVTRLENKGWIERTPDPTDGRYTLATLTDAGMTKVVEAAPGHVREVRRVAIDPLTRTQLRQLTGIGQRLLGALDPDNRFMGGPASTR